ncbi:unnamed protein product (mitochondrion) [Plasmodiophora brassicae]|uniref:UBA domain-containing protein n=1 Tax=Plasmodiophora brassicae TaxID=37360 RepID=A0A3P3Y3A2_PLABS|nr:unnamed protein product [Plasmodiophora brassicae]
MGNILDSDAGIGDPPGAQTWTLSLDCRPDALQPLLVCHGKRVILPPHHIYELVRIANAEHTEGTAQIHDRYGDLPTKCLPRAARLRAARLLCRERIHVPPDRDAAGIQSVPVSPAMALYQSNFGCLLIEFMCRARRVQLDIVGNRVRRALQGHPTASLRDSLRLKLVKQGLEDVPGIRGSAAGAMTILKKVRSLADREMVASEKALITNAFATEFEFATYGQLGPAFVAATSGGEIKKTFGTREDELCIAYLGTLWENLKASSVYSSLYRLRKENKSAVLGRLLLAFSASTASFHVLIQTASVLMMMSCENLNDDLRLPWQALNSLNCIRYSNPVQTSREGGRADDIPVATRKSPGVKCSVACAALVDVLATMCSQASNSDAPVPTLIIGFDSASFASLLELLNRCMYCYFARIRNEEVRRDSFDSELLADVHDAVVKLHRSDTSFEQRVSTARTLLKLVRLLKLDPTNPTFHTLYMDSDVLRRDIVNVPEAVHILDLIGYKFATADVKVVVKGISTVQQSNQFRASMVDVDALNQAGHELDLFLRQAWSALLPKLLSVLHFQICLIAKYRTYPAARDVRSADAVKKEYLSSAFQDLVRVIGSGFDDFQESRDPFRAATANWAIKVVCDGMQIFMPKASQQVSFLSRMFDASIPLTPSSSFKRDLVLTQPARKAISDYLFCVSSVSIDPGYLTDLAFGLDEDSWSNLVLDIKSEGSENIVWKRVCRVIADIQVSDSDFARYKNDPVVSPILNKIMRAGSSDAAPMKMATIHKALILLASPFPEAFESTHSTSFLSPKLGTVNSDRFAPAERAARLLFCFQRDLFNRSIVNGTRVDAVSCHPVLEFVRAFLGCTVQQADSISGFDGTISTEVQQFQFRKSLAGAYLPHVLLGIASTSRQFHPESSSLGDIIKMMQQLHASFGGFSGLAEVPLERLGGRRSKEYEYSSIEDILDGGNAVEDILIHPHFDLSVDSKVPEHGDQEKRSRIANSHMMFLLTSHNVSSDLVQLYVENSGAVLEALSNLQKQPQAISSIMAACPVLQRIVSTIVFGEYDMPNFAKAVELPSLYLCTMCGSTLPTIHDLVLHTFGFSSSGSSSTRATICSPSGLPAWFAFLRHLTAWVLAKLARNCVTGVGGDFNVLSGKLDQDTSGSSQGSPSESVQQWLKSILFKGGFDRTQYATELGDADGSCEIRVMKMSEDRRFFADLIDGKESAGALNKAVLDLPQFKGFPHRKSGGDAIAQATRSVVTVLLKHGGLTETARALAKKILDCSDDNKAELVTQPENSDLLKLWSVADSLKGHWVFLHQEGIQSVCIEKNCKQSVIYDSDFYRCSNGHENQQCETEDTLTYEAIRDSVVSKCMLLLNTESGCRIALHPALMRQTSTTLRRLLQRRSVDAARSDDGGSSPRSPSGRTITVTPFERWKMLRNTFLEMIPQFRSMNNPMFHRTISDAIIDFIKDERVDPRELSYSLESVVRRAHRRSQGFEILSQLSHRVPSSLKIAIVVELVSAVRDWPVLPDSIAPHFFDRIESAGVELLGSVRNAYAVVAGRAATLFNQIVNGNKDDSTLSALVLVDFWKIGFRLSDFVLLRSLRFTELLRLDTHRENYNLVQSALRRVFNAVSLLSFCHDRSDGIGVNSENAVRSDGRIDPWQGRLFSPRYGSLLLTRQAINSLLFLISLRPSGSADRRRSSVDNSRNAIVILDSDIRFQPSLMFAQLQAYGLKAFLSLLQSLPSLVSQDTLCAIIESPAFVRNLLQVARMPIPLHEASDLQDLEIKCCRLGMLVHDQRVIEQSYGILSIDKQTLRDSMDEHIDWCTKASQMFSKIPDGLELAKSWLVTQRNSVESARLRRNQTMTSSLSPKSQTGDMITRLSALGFPVVVCEKALRLCKGNETLAANWLMDNGAREAEVLAIDVRSTEALANPFSDECEWGTEGVDFFQEMGDGDVARDLLWRLPSDQLDGNFEAESDVYNRLALQPGDVQQTRDSEAVPDRAKSSVPSSSSLKHLSLSLTIDDLREGQAVRISRSWVSARDRVLGGEGTGGAGSGRYMYRWYLNSVQNTWEPFDDNVTAQLEERWRLGDSLCTAILDSEPFMFRLDRMAMYHSLTGYMVRLRRRRVEKSVQSPFQTVANKNEANDQSPVADEILSDEQILERMLDALSSSQRETVERVQLVVADMPKSWVVQALQKNNFDPNLAVEWIFANSTVLENLDKEQAKRREALLNPAPAKAVANSSSDDDPEADSSLFTPLLAYGGAIGTIVSIDRQRSRARVAFPLCSSDSGHPQVDNVPGVLCPLVALEWPDAWVGEEMPNEISQRRKLGVDGLLVDAYVALGIVFARRAVLSIMRLSLSGNNDSSPVTQIPAETTSEPQDENAQPSLTLSKLNLKVIDVISILKLVANDIDHMSSQGVSIWFLLRALAVHPKYSEEMLPFLIDDCIVHLRRSSSRVAEVSTAHPYPDSSQTKEEVYIENANELLVEFDRRSQLKEGHAVVSFWSDPECTSEIAIMSGTGFQSPGNSTGSGFRPFIVRGNRFFVQFGSGQPRPTGKVEFGFAVRVRPLGYRFEDERDILRAPLGWNLLSLLTSNDLIDSCLRHERCHDLVRALIRFLRCSSSPSKVFVTMSLEKLFSRYSEMYIDWGTRTSFLERIGGSGDIAGLQTTRDRVREANMRAPVGSSFSPFLKALEDLLRLTRVIFPQTAFQTYEIDVLQVVNGIPVNPWDMRIAIGKVTAVDVARVEMVLECLYNGRKLPSSQIFALSYEHLNTMALFRLCLKELETSIKLNKQISKWKDERRFWMSMVNTFKDVDYLADILLMLRRSMLDSAFEPMWSLRHKDWESRVREARTLAQYAVCLRDLEESFRWRDEKDDNRESALVTSWRASRPNWVKTVTTLSDEVSLARVQSSMPSSQEAERAPYWSREANEQLVAYVNALISQNARRLRSLTFVDITEPKPSELVTLYPSLKGIPMPHIRSRFGVLKMINQLVAAIIIPVAPLWNMQERSLGTLMRRCKRLIFHEAKLAILTQSVQRMYSKEKDPQNVILNRHEAAKERSAVNAAGKVLTPAIRHTIFFQLYSQLRVVDAESLRRKGQAWRVKFVGERGHDVGGLFNASLSNICDELMSYRLPLFVPTPNGKHKIGDNREKWMPSPSANDPQHIAWFEFVGKLMGIACLSQNRTLSIDLPSMVWKTIVREPLDLADLKAVDYPVYRTLHLMRRPEVESITEDTFEYVFPDLCFTAPNADGVEVELAPDDAHRQVTWANRLEYARAVEEFRLHELEVQIGAICRGLAQMLPIDLLALFTWQQLEVLVCGNPDIDIQLLREKTIYSGNVREADPHIQMFWRVIESFSAQDRREFLQFVWGRSRLPTTKVGFGKDAFKISDHTAAILAQNAMPLTYGTSMIHDQYLPVAHTCFFALELPRYSSDAIMSDKLLYAIHNCKTIDADTTQESQMNQNMSWSDGESDGEGETRATNEENRERGAQ